MNKIISHSRYILIASLLFLYGQAALAAPLNLTLFHPDAHLTGLDINYDDSTDIFTANSIFSFGYPASGGTIDGGSSFYIDFSLTANITGGNGGDPTFVSGNFTLNELDCDGTFPPTCTTGLQLISGNLVALGFANDTSQILEFLFDSTGGSLQPDYDAAPGGQGGIILSGTGYNDNNFDSSFTATSSSADVAPVPVPAAMWLFGSGLLGLASIARRKTL